MGTKSFFTKQKTQDSKLRGEERSTIQEVTSSIESIEYIKEFTKDKNIFLPEVDFYEPENFVKYGSAKDYYADLVSSVTQSYPYDGSLTERLKFKNDLVAIQRYEFDNNYPRSTGYADFSDSNYEESVNSFNIGTLRFGLGDSSTNHYIITDNYSKDMVYNTASNQVGGIELDFSEGVTVEFWMNKADFPDAGETQNEVIFSVSNTADDFFQITTDVTASSKILSCFSLQKGPVAEFVYEFDTELTTVADSKWHHYALAFSTNSAGYIGELYVDGHFKEKQYYTKGSPFLVLTGTLDATVAASSLEDYLGDGKLSGSLDEVRLWKTKRDAKQIGENYFFDVGGGGNSDEAKVNKYNPLELSLYYKFNEGNTGDNDIDSIVLDYSGRLTDGVWVGFVSGSSRTTGSAITDSGVTTEVGDPIIYGTHPDVVSYKSEKQTSGSAYDAENINSMHNMLPQWIEDEDSRNGLVIRKLVQIMASYLDTLHAQITAISSLQDGSYVSGSSAKPNPFSKRNLISYGFEIPDVFIDSEVIEEIYFKDEKRIYEDKLYNLKNLIFQNVFNNLNFINKSKGTEKSFRNLFRAFGTDNELIRLNMYADNQQYEFRENFEASQAKRNVIDLSGYNDLQSRNGVIYQFADTLTASAQTGDYGWLPTASNVYTPLTIENQIYFPKFVDFPDGHISPRLDRASLFGIHSASFDTEQTTFPVDDLFIKVYADTNTNNKTQFVLTSSIASVGSLTSSFYEGVYDNNPWTFAVRVKPREYPFANVVTSSDLFDFEFYGVNYNSGIKMHEFSASAEIRLNQLIDHDVGTFLTGSHKRLYLGADRENITGSLNYDSNVRLVSSRVWFDYLKDEELQSHARDVEIFGRKNPYQNSFVYEGVENDNYIPRIDTLALHWNFANITGSSATGKFLVQDITSGSSTAMFDAFRRKFSAGSYYDLVGRNYSGQGSGFTADSTNVVDFLFVDTSKQQLPENLYSSDLIEIRSQDDLLFTRESRPSKYHFSVETSLYDTISQNILGFFASIEDFNNLVGEPVNMYRPNYKNLEKLRALFFENIQNDPDLEKYVNLYKWLDGAIEGVLFNIIPASVSVSDKVRSVVESHLLERSKYRHKFIDVKEVEKEKSIIGNDSRTSGDIAGGYGKGGNRNGPPRDGTGLTADDLPRVTGVIIGAPLISLANMSFMVPEDIRKSKRVQDRSGMRPASDPLPIKVADLLAPLPENLSAARQDLSPLWYRTKAERETGNSPAGILATGDAGVDKSRVLSQINKAQNISASSQSPVSLNVDAITTIGAVSTFGGENRSNYFPNSFKLGKAFNEDGILIEPNLLVVNNKSQPYYDYSGAIDQTYDSKRHMPISISDEGNGVKLGDKKYLPFDLLSASTSVSPYQRTLLASEFFASVEMAHKDHVVEGSSLQGPFTDEHVGGWMYRHGTRLKTSVQQRKEGYHFNIKENELYLNNPRILGPTAGTETRDRPLGNYLRNVVAKRPVNIQNISGSRYDNDPQTSIIGNYQHDYEIIQTAGRKENNRYYISSSGNTGSVDSSTRKIAYDADGTYTYKDFEVLDRASGSNSFVFVNRFSAPGGPEVSAFSYLDIEAAEYSVYNNLNYRNQTVRLANRDLLTRHTLTGGYDSVLLQTNAAYYKPQRNGIYRLTGAATKPCEPQWDNSYVNYSIPRTDVQYSWVASSWVYRKLGYPNATRIAAGLVTSSVLDSRQQGTVATSPEISPIYGFEYSTGSGLTLISSSDVEWTIDTTPESPGCFVPFNGMNFIIAGKIDLDNNLFTTASDVIPGGSDTAHGDYINPEAIATSVAATNFLTSAPYILNSFLLNNNGPYQHPTFKQIRGGDHRVARVIRNNNLYKTQLDSFSDDRNRLNKAGTTFTITQSAVTSKFKPIIQHVDDITGTIQYTFGNLYDYFAKTYNSDKNEIEDLNVEMGAPATDIYNSDFYKFSQKYQTIRYDEVIYPREENEYRDLVRNREKYISFWDSNDLDIRILTQITNSQGDVINASRWLLDVSPTASNQRDLSGELMRITGSTGVSSSLENQRNARYSFNLGECRPNNLVQSQASFSGAFYTSYGAFATDVRVMGQDETIIPEFTISDFVGEVTKDYNGDFTEESVYSFSLTGSKTMSSSSFFETYGKTEKLTYLKELKDFYGEPTAIKVTFNATKKLLPKDGFYPVQRTLQLASQFSSSHALSTLPGSLGVGTKIPIGANKTYETALMPFWAPGVGYNSIKAGFAVEFPYKDGTEEAEFPGWSGSLGKSFNSTAPFEAILSPSEYVTGAITHIVDSSSAGSKMILAPVDSTASVNRSDGIYELMSHNFFAEVPEFFLENLSTFKSSPQKTWEFKGPLSSSQSGVYTPKKFSMDIVIEHPPDFLMYGNQAAFGPRPYNNHCPPGSYFNGLGAFEGPACPNYQNISGLRAGSGRGAHTRTTLTFDPTELLGTATKRGQTSFTLKDIVANSIMEHEHSLSDLYSNTDPLTFMTITSSVDIFNIDEEGRWVIKSKWECPVLNFDMDVVTGTSAGQFAEQPTHGMWHQYGVFAGPNDRKRVHVRLEDSRVNNTTLTGSLLEAVGFPPEARAFGKIKNQKIVEEAVCAVPFYVENSTGEEKFFELPINIFENRYEQVRTNKITNDSISDMIRKMDKYVVPPPYDFVDARDKSRKVLSSKLDYKPVKPPFAMYIMEFSSKLNKQDLANIWQGVPPTIGTSAEKEKVVLEHPIADGELLSPSIFKYNNLSSIPSDIRWKVFKIKKRASYDYYRMIEEQTGVPTYKRSKAGRFSFNWPYDYFSLVELGKMEVGFEVQNDSPNRIKDIRGGGYITPEEAVKKSINLGTPITAPKGAPRPTAPSTALRPSQTERQTLDPASVEAGRLATSPVFEEQPPAPGFDFQPVERFEEPAPFFEEEPAFERFDEPAPFFEEELAFERFEEEAPQRRDESPFEDFSDVDDDSSDRGGRY